MDEMTVAIGILLVWTGAVFIGHPIGYLRGKRAERRKFGEVLEVGGKHLPVPVFRSRRRLEAKDILSAEIIEEVQQ